MRILTIADKECRALWDYYQPGTLKGVDLILSCGDLDPDYLQFLVTMAGCPLLYVRGNHDERYDRKPPLGCTCIEDKVYDFHGLRILGLGGSMRYKNSPCMYTEAEMQARIRKAGWQIRLMGGFDILLTHAPAKDGRPAPSGVCLLQHSSGNLEAGLYGARSCAQGIYRLILCPGADSSLRDPDRECVGARSSGGWRRVLSAPGADGLRSLRPVCAGEAEPAGALR